MLARKADQRKTTTSELNQLYYRLAKTADELGNSDKALKLLQARLRPRLDVPADAARPRRAALQDGGLGRRVQDLPDHPGPPPRLAEGRVEIVDIFYRLGNIKLKQGERKKALNMFEKALEIEAAHRADAAGGHRAAAAARATGRRSSTPSGAADASPSEPTRRSSCSTRSATSTTRSCRTRRRRSPPTSRRSRCAGQSRILHKVLDLYSRDQAVEEGGRDHRRSSPSSRQRSDPQGASTTTRRRASARRGKSTDEAIDLFNQRSIYFRRRTRSPSELRST